MLEMASQSLQAIEEANICLFLVDAKDGLLPDDNRILDHLRKRSKNTYLVVNKIDGRDPDAALVDFYSLRHVGNISHHCYSGPWREEHAAKAVLADLSDRSRQLMPGDEAG